MCKKDFYCTRAYCLKRYFFQCIDLDRLEEAVQYYMGGSFCQRNGLQFLLTARQNCFVTMALSILHNPSKKNIWTTLSVSWMWVPRQHMRCAFAFAFLFVCFFSQFLYYRTFSIERESGRWKTYRFRAWMIPLLRSRLEEEGREQERQIGKRWDWSKQKAPSFSVKVNLRDVNISWKRRWWEV